LVNTVAAMTAEAAGDMSGRPGRARHTAGRSSVTRDSRMPLPKSLPSDRRRRHASLRAEARDCVNTVVYYYIIINMIQQPPSAAEFGKGWFFNCSSSKSFVFFGIETIMRPAANIFGFNIVYRLDPYN